MLSGGHYVCYSACLEWGSYAGCCKCWWPFESLLGWQRVALSEVNPSQDQLFLVHMNCKDLDSSPRWGCSERAFELPSAVLEVGCHWAVLQKHFLFGSLVPTGFHHNLLPTILHLRPCFQGGQLITFVLILYFTLAFLLTGNSINLPLLHICYELTLICFTQSSWQS